MSTRSTCAGTRLLLGEALRHNRVRIGIWVSLPVLLAVSSVAAYPALFPQPSDRAQLQVAMSANPAFAFLLGPATAVDTVDGFTVWRSLNLGVLLIGIGTALLMVRLTRAQEESGMAELERAQVVGRHAHLAAALAVTTGMSVITGLLSALGCVLFDGGVTMSVLLGAAYTGAGLLMAAVAGLAAQLWAQARSASTAALGTLGACFALRGLAQALDLPDWVMWTTPLGWLSQVDPAGQADAWPVVGCLGLSLVLWAVAWHLAGRREYGAALLEARPGRERARGTGVGVIVWHCCRPVVITWLATAVLMGLVFGWLTASMTSLIEADSVLASILAAGALTRGEITAAFLHTVMGILAVFAAFAGLHVTMRAWAEEPERLLEAVLAGGVSRWRWWGAWTVAAAGTALTHVALTTALIAAIGSASDARVSARDAVVQGAVVGVGALALVAFGLLVVAAWPRLRALAWALAGGTLLLDMLGPTMRASEGVMGLSVFHHVPTIGVSGQDWAGFALLGVLAAVLTLAGLPAFRRRDLT